MDEAKGSELLATLCDARSSSVHDRLVPLRCHVGVDRAGVGLKTSFLLAMPFVPTSFLLLVERPGDPGSVLAPSSDALCSY